MFIRQVEVFAAYWAYSDHEIGRVIQQIEDMGKLDNTLIIYIAGDNGNSAEGSVIGTPNEVASLQGIDVPVEDQLKYFYAVWGHGGGMDMGIRHAVLLDQADRVALRRRAAGMGDGGPYPYGVGPGGINVAPGSGARSGAPLSVAPEVRASREARQVSVKRPRSAHQRHRHTKSRKTNARR
jgi:arylsulfatase A-like enzyme